MAWRIKLLRLGIDVNDSEVDTSESEEQDLREMTENVFAFLALIENNDTDALVDYFLEHYSAVWSRHSFDYLHASQIFSHLE